MPRVAEFIYIEGDNKRVSSARIINCIYNENPVNQLFFFLLRESGVGSMWNIFNKKLGEFL